MIQDRTLRFYCLITDPDLWKKTFVVVFAKNYIAKFDCLHVFYLGATII